MRSSYGLQLPQPALLLMQPIQLHILPVPLDRQPPDNWAEAQEPSQGAKVGVTPPHTPSGPLTPGQDQTHHYAEIHSPLNQTKWLLVLNH